MSDVTIERIGPDGWPLWRDLRLAALAGDAHAFGSRLADWQHADEARWRARLESNTNFVARLNGTPAGMASGAVNTAGGAARFVGDGEVMSFWVAPAARGRGVGDALIAAVQDWARTKGLDGLRLSVRSANAPAIRSYERGGFRDAGPVSGDPPERLMLWSALDSAG